MDNSIDFTTATTEKKKEIIVELFQKQKELASFKCNNFILDPSVRIYLMFIITVCNTDFSEFLFDSIENKYYAMEDFTSFLAKKLNDYMCQNIGIEF